MTFPLEAVLAQLEATHAGAPWYGTSRAGMLDTASVEEAKTIPADGGPTVWALVLHMTSWTREVTRRLAGIPGDAPVEGDWPTLPHRRGSREWTAALRRLDEAHARLLEAARAVPPARWSDPVPWADGDPGDTTFAEMLVGLAQHDAYHVGQVAVVLRGVRAVGRR